MSVTWCTNKSGIHLTGKSRQACPLHRSETSATGAAPSGATSMLPSLFALKRGSAERAQDATASRELRSLAAHESDVTRRVAARNEACPPDAVRSLADDPSEMVRMAVARREHIDPDVLVHMTKNDPTEHVRALASTNSALPVDALPGMMSDPSAVVRMGVTRNPRLPDDALVRALQDRSRHVQTSVGREIDRRISARLGIAPDNTEAIAFLRDQEWWAMQSDDPAVTLVRSLYPDA